LEADRPRAGIVGWPDNALRQTFASYALEHFKQPGTLTVEMGHTDEDLVSRFYRQRVRPEATKKWWSIMPQQTESKIVELEGAVAVRLTSPPASVSKSNCLRRPLSFARRAVPLSAAITGEARSSIGPA
jgi:hypothetical protein